MVDTNNLPPEIKEEINNLSPEAKFEIDSNMGIIQLITGEAGGKPFWVYASMYPSTYIDYMQKVAANENVNLEEYGIILKKGWGSEPPQEVKDEMRNEYGADEGFQEELLKLTEEIYKNQHSE